MYLKCNKLLIYDRVYIRFSFPFLEGDDLDTPDMQRETLLYAIDVVSREYSYTYRA